MELKEQVEEFLDKTSNTRDPDQSFVLMEPCLAGVVHRADGNVEDKGVLGRKAVTTAFVNYLVGCMNANTANRMDVFCYHAPGSGSAAESSNDTTMTTEVGVRQSGTLTTKTGTANIFQSVATVTFTAAAAIAEHGLFSTNTGGTLLDRTSFATISVASGDSIAFTYQLTVAPGS